MRKVSAELKPVVTDGRITSVHVRILLSEGLPGRESSAAAGEELFFFNRRVVNRYFPKLLGELLLTDERGRIPYHTCMRDIGQVEQEGYYPERPTRGVICLEYEGELSEVQRNPVFDLGREDGGMDGSGMVFLPGFPQDRRDCAAESRGGAAQAGEIVPGDNTGVDHDSCGERNERYHYSVHWDLSDLPEGAGADWTMGKEAFGDGNLLQESFYAAGEIHTIRNGRFAFSWLGAAPDAMAELAGWTGELFLRMAEFFGDGDQPYHIFARKAPCPRCGGTALVRSYLFIYQDEYLESLDDVKLLFAHEMVHNWPSLSDDPFGTGTWYVEGTAEYYSLVLSWRFGLIDSKRAAEILNRRGADYYENPCIGLSALECGRGFPDNAEATLVPYGRGMFYLMRTEGWLAQTSGGALHLDDIVLELLRSSREGTQCTNEDWLKLLREKTGQDRREDCEAMLEGAVQEPCVDLFEGAVAAEPVERTQRGTGRPCTGWHFRAV